MACEHPIQAFRPALGGPILFHAPTNGRAYNPIEIPCGYCLLCREEQARQWAVRITHEANMHADNCFITLTYDNAHVPPDGGLRYEDLQKFWKRLRYELGEVRYYAVGEYGDKTQRPHYHACVFGHAFTEDRIILRETPNLLWTSPLLQRLWGMGNVSVGALNFTTANYTASYVTKQLRRRKQYVRTDEETGELIKLEQPRPFMSRNIAKDWWKQYGKFVENHDQVIIDGRKQKPPKAYDKWLKEKDETKIEEIKEKRKRKAKKSTYEERRARARNARAHAETKKKTI